MNDIKKLFEKGGCIIAPIQKTDALYEQVFGSEIKQEPFDWSPFLPLFETQKNTAFCFLPDTLVLMEDLQWKKIKDIRIGEKVITHLSNIKEVIQTITRIWQGRIYEISFYGNYKTIKCTPEHPFWILRDGKKQFIEAKNLKTTDKFIIPRLKNIIKDICIKEIYKNPLFLELLGWYLAEGSTGKSKKQNSWRTCFYLGYYEMAYAKRIKYLLKEVFKEEAYFEHIKKHNRLVVGVKGQEISETLEEYGGKYADKKRIHQSLMFLEPELQLEIVKSWLLGDGSFRQGRTTGVTISEKLSEQIRMLLIRNGIKCSVLKRTTRLDRKQGYDIHINGDEIFKLFPAFIFIKSKCGKSKNSRMDIDDDNVYVKIKNIKKTFQKTTTGRNYNYTKTYNLEIKDDNTYIAETLAVHNCVSFSRLNVAETIAKAQGFDFNLSDRHLGVLSGTTKSGNNLNAVSEAFRTLGIVREEYFSWKEGQLENPSEHWQEIFDLSSIPSDARRFFGGNHSWINGKSAMKSALAFSPLQIAFPVYETYENEIVKKGKTVLGYHCVMLYFIGERGNYYIFDSVNGEKKILDKDYPILQCKSFRDLPENWKLTQQQIKEKTILQIIGEILKKLAQVLGLMKKQVELLPVTPQPPTPIINHIPYEPQDLPKKYDWDTPQKSRHSCRMIMDTFNLKWAEKDLLCAVIQAESGFDIKATHKNKNNTMDWGICMFNDGKNKDGIPYWIGEGATFKNVNEVLTNPEKCVKIMCQEFLKGHLFYWVAYQNKSYLRYL